MTSQDDVIKLLPVGLNRYIVYTDRTGLITLIILFLVSHFNFLFIPCGRLSWLPVSFLLHVKYLLSYRIKPTYSAKLPRKVYSFNSAKAERATIKAKTTQYTEGYLRSHQSNSVDQNWTSIKKHLLDMLDKHIPSQAAQQRCTVVRPMLKSMGKSKIRPPVKS